MRPPSAGGLCGACLACYLPTAAGRPAGRARPRAARHSGRHDAAAQSRPRGGLVTHLAPIRLTKELVLQALQDVKDPEIPVVSIVDLGIVQDITLVGGRVTVSITPTFTG